ILGMRESLGAIGQIGSARDRRPLALVTSNRPSVYKSAVRMEAGPASNRPDHRLATLSPRWIRKPTLSERNRRHQRRTATTRKPMWSLRRSGSNRARKADRQGQPSSAQHPPRRTRDTLPSRLIGVEFLAE